MLSPVRIPSEVDQIDLTVKVQQWIERATARIEAFQDCWERPQIEQFVAADYRHVYQSLVWTLQTQNLLGRRFLEWGSGFAVVSVLASSLDLDVIGIEAERDLFDQGLQTIRACQSDVQLVHGNFLPPGGERLSEDPTLPSIGHPVASAYQQIGLDLDDFAIVYAYPWPGEDDFHERVFDQYAAVGALLMLFCGPNDVRLWRKVR